MGVGLVALVVEGAQLRLRRHAMRRARVGRPRLERAAHDLRRRAASESGRWPTFALTRPRQSARAEADGRASTAATISMRRVADMAAAGL